MKYYCTCGVTSTNSVSLYPQCDIHRVLLCSQGDIHWCLVIPTRWHPQTVSLCTHRVTSTDVLLYPQGDTPKRCLCVPTRWHPQTVSLCTHRVTPTNSVVLYPQSDAHWQYFSASTGWHPLTVSHGTHRVTPINIVSLYPKGDTH